MHALSGSRGSGNVRDRAAVIGWRSTLASARSCLPGWWRRMGQARAFAKRGEDLAGQNAA